MRNLLRKKEKEKDLLELCLCALFNQKEQRFETFTKVGTGFTEAMAKEINSLLKCHILSEPSKNVSIKNRMLPDIFVEPAVVIEVLRTIYRKLGAYCRGNLKKAKALLYVSHVF